MKYLRVLLEAGSGTRTAVKKQPVPKECERMTGDEWQNEYK